MIRNFELGFSTAFNLANPSWIEGEKPDGFSFVEICAGYHPVENEEARRECMRIYLEDYKRAVSDGLKLWSVHLPYGDDLSLLAETPAWEQSFQNFLYYINELKSLAPKCYVVHIFVHEPLVTDDREALVRRANENIKSLAEAVAKTGAVLCVEALPRTNIGNTAAECLRLIENTNAALCLDVNHLTTETHKYFMSVAGSKVKTVHLSDYDFVDEKHWIPNDGILDWNMILDLFEKYGYTGPLMFEAKFHKNGKPARLCEIRDGFQASLGK